MRRLTGTMLAGALCLALAGCGGGSPSGEDPDAESSGKQQVTINVTCPPMTMAYDADHPDAEIMDLFQEAGERFAAAYEDADVTFNYAKYQYVDEKEQVTDKFGTPEAADVVIGGSFNLPTYIREGRVAPLDDVIDDALRADIDEAIWEQATYEGQTYAIPYFNLQNTLMVNEDAMRVAGLERYLPEEGAVAQWSTDEFNDILQALRASMSDESSYPLALYAANNQGDTHVMTLLRAYGASMYDGEGRFDFSSPEGVQALAWIASLNEQGIVPKGAENMEYTDAMKLFYSGQIALCPGNMVNVRVAEQEQGLHVVLANFPNQEGNGMATSYLNGFSVMDNGDADKVRVAKDFVRFIYSDDEFLRYSLSGVPAVKSYALEHRDEVDYMDAYSRNAENTVNIIGSTPNWEGVRAAFYPNMQSLLRGTSAPEEAAAAIDDGCNAAIDEGLAAIEAVRAEMDAAAKAA